MASALLAAAALALAAGGFFSSPSEAASRRIEVAEADGILDGSVLGSIRRTVRAAQESAATAVVVQIDSVGGVDPAALDALVDEMLGSSIPVIAWVGPPGARAEGAAAVLATGAHVVATSPGSAIGPARSVDLRERRPDGSQARRRMIDISFARNSPEADVVAALVTERFGADRAEDSGLVVAVAPQLPDLLAALDGTTVIAAGKEVTLDTDTDGLSVRFRKMGVVGRVQHAVAQPTMVYLLLLLGLVGVVFELFHPSTGPAGVTGLLSLLLAGYGAVVLGASPLGIGLVVVGIAFMAVDLRLQSLGVFTLLGIAGLVAGSVFLFPAPYLRADPWILGLGCGAMVAFMIGAMTRVLSDLRAVASGELEVTDPVESLHRSVSVEQEEDRGS